MPIIPNTYSSPFVFKNGHFNTIYKTLFYTGKANYNRKRMFLKDGDFLDLDFSMMGSENLVIAMHGLEGSSASKYMISACNYLNSKKMDVLALNFRGCSGEDNLKLYSYNSGKSDDLYEVIAFVSDNYNYNNIFLLGYSMGGNIALKYLGENSDVPKIIKGAVAISVPCDLEGSSHKLGKWYNKIYMAEFLKTLKKKSLLKIERFPNHKLNRDKIKACKNFTDFDNAVTAPLFGYKDAKDYWTSCSSNQFLAYITTPTLLINALDDSFLSESCYPIATAKQHANLYLETPKYGGHVGFNTQLFGKDDKWSEARIYSFFDELLNK